MLDQDFDIKVRSMLEDAVEEVPEGVWEGVSGALDKAAGRKKAAPVFWWRMLGGLTAAAAAVALGVFLWPDRKGNFSVLESTDVNPVAVVAPTETDSLSSVPATAAPSEVPPVLEKGRNQGLPASPSLKTVRNTDETPQTTPSVLENDQNQGQPDGASLITAQNKDDEAVPSSDTEGRQPDTQTAVSHQGTFPEFNAAGSGTGIGKIRTGQVSLSLSGNAFATGRPSNSATPGVTRMAAPAAFRAPKTTGVTPVSKEATYGMPFTVGVGVKYYVLPRFAVSTGVNYSLLVRSFVGTYNEVSTSVEDGVEHSALVRSVTSDIFNDQHYIGVPLTLTYDYVQTNRVRAYVRADGMIEKNVKCHYRFHSTSEQMSYTEKVKGVQWSAGAGLGVEVRLGKHVGIYADPGVRYYFKGNQPSSLRTVQPLMVDINAGVRFNIN